MTGNTRLFTHHHYGWRMHDLPNSHYENLLAALEATHGFLPEYDGKYRVEVERTPACSYQGVVHVFWDAEEPKTFAFGPSMHKGDIWFRAFEFNQDDEGACRFCGGTGMDHYVGPFFHCWACDGSRVQLRRSIPRGFMHKPTAYASQAAQNKYAQYLALSDAATTEGRS